MQPSQPGTPEPAHLVELARATAAANRPREAVFAHFGFELVDVGPGRASLAMTVRPDMLNAGSVCHGGIIFTLADSAFGTAANSHNQRALSAAASIEFLNPAVPGDRLLARASESHRAGRMAIYDVRVERADGTLIALMRGRAATVKGTVLADAPAA